MNQLLVEYNNKWGLSWAKLSRAGVKPGVWSKWAIIGLRIDPKPTRHATLLLAVMLSDAISKLVQMVGWDGRW